MHNIIVCKDTANISFRQIFYEIKCAKSPLAHNLQILKRFLLILKAIPLEL